MQVREEGTMPVARAVRSALLRPFVEFARLEASGGILLIVAAAAAIVWANSSAAESYFHLWESHARISFQEWALDLSLHEWINDGLMALFFLVVGLEIKREIVLGELSSPKRAAFPIAAAIGGMAVPAVIFLAFTSGTPYARGWGIPTATDIAFSLGALALLGSRVPVSLKIFLTAFAIVDDLGAVLVIALFYNTGISLSALALAGLFFMLLILANLAGERRLTVYSLLGVGLWLSLLHSGVHATIAGVLLAFTIPARVRLYPREFVDKARSIIERLRREAERDESPLSQDRQDALQTLERACLQAQMPLQRLEHILHPWTTYCVLPIFALANAGVAIESGLGSAFSHPMTIGITLGLLVGKSLGVLAAAYLAVRLRLAALPRGLAWGHLFPVAVLGGIGFTMSLFISNLAFTDAEARNLAKAGILLGSLASGVIGTLLLSRKLKKDAPDLTANEE